MNIKFSSLTLLIAAVAGIGFSQAAQAGEGAPNAPARGMRFDYAPNTFAVEQPTGRRGRYAAPHTEMAPVAAGAVPKMSLDRDFVSKPAPPPPPPVVAAAPVASPSVSAKMKVPSTFGSIFNPVKSDPALVAASPGQLPAFGAPAAQKLPLMAKAPTHFNSNLNGKLLTPTHARPLVAHQAAPFKMPTIKSVGSGYTAGANIPMATNTGSSTSTNVAGVIVGGARHK